MVVTTSFSTSDCHGFSVKYSPFLPNLLACATSENYGIAGKGALLILDIGNANGVRIVGQCNWSDGLFDVTWSEANPDLIVTCSNSGSVQIWDRNKPCGPISGYKIHEKEVCGVDWNPRNEYPFILSASWDTTVKLWDPFVGCEVSAFRGHEDMVYAAIWSAHSAHLFGSASADTTLKLWDMRTPAKPLLVILHPTEVLTCDWCKLNPNILASGSTDGLVRGWDIRSCRQPIFQLVGHQYAVRRLKFSPFHEGFLSTVSYDFSTRFWDWSKPEALHVETQHTEFVYGLDFSPFKKGQVCDCAWDTFIHIYNEAEF